MEYFINNNLYANEYIIKGFPIDVQAYPFPLAELDPDHGSKVLGEIGRMALSIVGMKPENADGLAFCERPEGITRIFILKKNSRRKV